MDTGTIEVIAKFSPLAFMYALVRANIEVDGVLVRKGWGTHSIEVGAGPHVVCVSYPWFPARRAGQNQVTVEVHPGETVSVEYTAGLLRFLPGTMRVADPLPGARVVKR